MDSTFSAKTQPFSFGYDMCGADKTMQSIFAARQDQLNQFTAAKMRDAGDPALKDFMPAVRPSKLALGLVGTANGIYKLIATRRARWRRPGTTLRT